MANVHAKLAAEELEAAKRGEASLHEMSPHTFLRVGFELEEQQYVASVRIFALINGFFQIRRALLRTNLGRNATSLQTAELLDKRSMLRRRIERWQEVQLVYMPVVDDLRRQDAAGNSSDYISNPETILLYLPSSIPKEKRAMIHHSLLCTELLMRVAQADDSLARMKKVLRVTMGLKHYKYTQLGPSQRSGTRSRTMIESFNKKIDRSAERYRAAWTILAREDPEGDWRIRLRKLEKSDVRAPGREHDDKDVRSLQGRRRYLADGSTNEGNREISWIWLSSYASFVSEEEMQADLIPTAEEIGDSALLFF